MKSAGSASFENGCVPTPLNDELYALATASNRMGAWLARVVKQFNQICGEIFVTVDVALLLR